MATFQPLYFSGGRYSSATERKFIASLIASDSLTTGVRVAGVIPAGINNNALKVTAAGANTLSIAPGMCMIADNIVPSLSSGLFLAGIDGSAQTVSFSTNNGSNVRSDSVYAVVDDTGYIITKKELTSNTATLTTSAAHGFAVGETVSVSGVDEVFDGSHVITAITTTPTHTFSFEKTATDVTAVNVRAEVRLGSRWAAVTSKAINITTNTVTLTISNTSGEFAGTAFGAGAGGDVGQVVTVKGVDATIDGSYVLATASSTSVTFLINKPVTAVTQTPATPAVQNSSVARARVPFAIKVDVGNAGTYASKNKIRLATCTVPAGGGTVAAVTDTRVFTTTMGGIHYYTSTAPAPSGVAGRFRYNVSTNSLEYYTTAWNSILQIGTTATTAAAGNHDHGTVYATTGHGHSGVYAPTSHTHTISQISGYNQNTDCPTYVDIEAPASDGVTSSAGITVSATTFTNITGVSTSVSLAAATYCLIQWSCHATAGTGGTVNVAPSVSGATTISASVSDGTSSNQSAATDGTAYGSGDIASTNATGSGFPVYGSRLVKLNSGANSINLQAYRTVSNGTINYPVVRVIPLRKV